MARTVIMDHPLIQHKIGYIRSTTTAAIPIWKIDAETHLPALQPQNRLSDRRGEAHRFRGSP